jgi:hypothetical protein
MASRVGGPDLGGVFDYSSRHKNGMDPEDMEELVEAVGVGGVMQGLAAPPGTTTFGSERMVDEHTMASVKVQLRKSLRRIEAQARGP